MAEEYSAEHTDAEFSARNVLKSAFGDEIQDVRNRHNDR
jgi:hypothetical protein